VVLKDAQDAAARTQTEELLKKLAADPANGINRIVDRDELMKLGGFPEAAFLIDMKPGYQIAFSLNGPLTRETKEGGTHGYLPEHPELRAAFFIAGPGIAKGKDLGVIDMRQIAPTLAQILNVRLAAARAEVLPLR
jgi:predicted AlkP superfamily pyrophosphatase or phosphodiesterase